MRAIKAYGIQVSEDGGMNVYLRDSMRMTSTHAMKLWCIEKTTGITGGFALVVWIYMLKCNVAAAEECC